MTEFVTVAHDGIEGTGTLPRSALEFLPGWHEVSDPVPELVAGSVDHVLTDVGDDPVKAAAALAAENTRTSPRSTLVAALSKLTEES